MKELSIQKWGNSAAVRLPAIVLKELGLATGDTLSIEMHPEGLLLKPKRPRYTLEQLVAMCDPKAPPVDDMRDWLAARPVGKELW